MTARWLFLAAYICSGMAGLIYQVTWTRLFALYLGHSTAAASTVLAAFMGGLCGGAVLGGRLAGQWSPRRALHVYALLELIVLASALAVPAALGVLAPRLRTFYGDGSHTLVFESARVLVCIGVLLVPALALGATFPFAVRWFARSGALYAANTVGAAIGALLTGFVLLKSLGHTRTILIGAAASAASAAVALILARRTAEVPAARVRGVSQASRKTVPFYENDGPWIGMTILTLTGFATFVFEIAWMRLFAMVIGPSTYAFSATVSAFIAALAIGSVLGTFLSARTRRPAAVLGLALAIAGISALWASSYAGTTLPRRVAEELASTTLSFGGVLALQIAMVASIIMPSAIALGTAFPLALGMAAGSGVDSARRAGSAYGLNTLGSVAGSLAAGFLTIPLAGLEHTIRIGAAVLFVSTVLIAMRVMLPGLYRRSMLTLALAGGVLLMTTPPWDRELLAGGAYHVPIANAGTLLYYREGATGTVSVASLNGGLSLAIDGKVDASTSDDMLTQKMLAHLPLLLHGHPRTSASSDSAAA